MSRARVLADRANQNTLAVDTTNSEVGIASTVPNATLDVRGEVKVGTAVQLGVAGVVTATSFSGSGSNLTGLATTETVRTDTLTVAGVSTLTGVTNVTGAANFASAVNVDATTDSTSSTSGALIVDGGLGVAKNVYIGAGLSVAGTLTYEDVTNVDSVGLITAKSGVNVSGGQLQVGVAYSVGAAGVATAAGFVGPLTGAVTGNVTGNASGTAGGLTGTPNISCGTIAGSTGSFTGDVDIADKIVHTGDTNTAIRFPSADTITAETGGSERLRIKSNGYVGIGTNNPAFFVSIRDAAPYIRIEDTAAPVNEKTWDFNPGTDGILRFRNTNDAANSSNNWLEVERDGVDTSSIRLLTGTGSERLRITSDGDLGVGDNSPDARLHVTETIDVAYTLANVVTEANNLVKLENPSTTANAFSGMQFRVGSGADMFVGAIQQSANAGDLYVVNQNSPNKELVRIKSTGLVGIGTDVPASLLDVVNTGGAAEIVCKSSTQPRLMLKTTGTTSECRVDFGDSGDSSRGAIGYNHSDDALKFYTTGVSNERLRITSAGKIGVGTATPGMMVHINGVGTNDILKLTANGSGQMVNLRNHSDVPNIVRFSNYLGNSFWDVQYNTDNSFALDYQDGEKFRLDSSGRLLLGTTTEGQASADDLTIATAGATGITIRSATNANGNLFFSDGTSGADEYRGYVQYQHNVDTLELGSNGATRLKIDTNGGFIFSNGALLEKCNITAGKLSDNTNIDLDDGMVHYFTTQESTTSTPNIRVNSSTSLNSIMTAGDVVSVTLITTTNASGYSANVNIDGVGVTEEWVGGAAPTEGGADGLDVYSYTIICTHATNTGNSGFKVIANLINATN